ncbi:MAG TPA: LON peptidase substrate-binding domain-containing protein [Candidatus Binataceae bacterium]|nr:LON peptidase substrate-binding domain-containing protein [Candidatus Binataceae bacterium]
MAELPSIIPIFPLPNFVLFPGVLAPLHIFEPRYREMIADVSSSHGLIGMTMLKGNWERDYYANPDLYEIGCAGRIGAMKRLPDGRYDLILEGLAEFKVVHEMRDHPYRTAEVEWRPVPSGRLDLDPLAMENLRDLLVRFLGSSAESLWRSLVEERGLRGAALINFICFHLDVNPIEKLTLLEAGESRATCLNDVLTFRLEERKLGPGPSGGDSGPLQ